MGLSNSKSSTRVMPTRHVRWSSDVEAAAAGSGHGHDFTSDLPDKLLAYIFNFLCSRDRKTSSTVCRRWLRVDAESRHGLHLYADRHLISFLPSILTRFDSIKRLTLWCDGRSPSVSDEALVLISKKCRCLKTLKLLGCRDLTDHRIVALGAKCKTLRMLSCSSSSSFATNTLGGADWGETSKEHVINLDVPGLKKGDMKIEVEKKRVLRISGERKISRPSEGDDKEEKGGERVVWHGVERSGGWFWFWRRFKLPKNADMDNVKAHLEDRVLKIRVLKLAEEYKKKKPPNKLIQIIS